MTAKKIASSQRKRPSQSSMDEEISVTPETFDATFDDAFDAALETVTEDDFLTADEIETEALYDEQSFDTFFGDEGGDEANADPQSKKGDGAPAVLTTRDLDTIAAKAAASRKNGKHGKKRGGKSGKPATDLGKGAQTNTEADAETGAGAGSSLGAAGRLLEMATPLIVWGSVACVLAALLYAVFVGGANWVSLLILAGGILTFFAMLLVGGISNAFSPLLLTGVLFRRARGVPKADAIQLAGKDILHPLGIAEDVLDVDVDARLVTTTEGVVVYANASYMAIAKEAGVRGASGLPPRIDRLFAQAGPESRKIFRLCRAAKSGIATEEVITQMMGVGKTSRFRRFEITIRPMRQAMRADTVPAGETAPYIAWRLREMAVEEVADTLATAYHDYPRPVIGLEHSGRIAWMNKATGSFLGVSPRTQVDFSDIILGESAELVDALWSEEDSSPIMCRMRRAGGQACDTQLTAFHRGGVGEGFLCVELQPDAAEVTDQAALSGDVTEAPFGVAVVEGDIGSDAKIVEANRMFADIFELNDKAPLLNDSFAASTVRDIANAIKNRSANSALARPVEVQVGKEADARFLALYAKPVKRRRGSYGKRQTVLYAVDVTFQKRMEEDYSQDQKLKTIGHLAGTIAHDFNNVLLVILGSVELLMRRHAVGDPSYPDLVQIHQNAHRARNLTGNLLAFSRKQTLQSEVLSVTEMLREFSPFLNRTITERIQLDVINGRGLAQVKADKGQLELAIMNLAVNARDAMPEGGKITIETINVSADDIADYGYAILDDVDHVLIEVSDTGKGVPLDIADKIFEPFFTTKGEGKGTGLGLSTVYGVIGQMGGRIFLHNRPDEGATFRIFLPAYQATGEETGASSATEKAKPQAADNADLTGRGRILIVEDEDGARSVIVRALELCGYEIVEACDGDEALEIIEEAETPFDLVLSDIMMPEMDGPTLVENAQESLGDAKVIFMSGYAEGAMREKLDQIEGAGYLQKPFSLKTVAAKVKEALAG